MPGTDFDKTVFQQYSEEDFANAVDSVFVGLGELLDEPIKEVAESD